LSVDPNRLRAFIVNHGNELARQQLERFEAGPYHGLPKSAEAYAAADRAAQRGNRVRGDRIGRPPVARSLAGWLGHAGPALVLRLPAEVLADQGRTVRMRPFEVGARTIRMSPFCFWIRTASTLGLPGEESGRGRDSLGRSTGGASDRGRRDGIS
jgi:hypothetical protein